MNGKYVFFDLDDTLYMRSEPFIKAFIKYTGRKDIDADIAYRAFTKRGEEVFEASQKGIITMEEMYIHRTTKGFGDIGIVIGAGEALEFQKIYQQMLNNITLSPEVEKVLDNCLTGYECVGLITNGPSGHQRGKIKSLGLDRWMEKKHIFISEEFGVDKPDLSIFRAAAGSCDAKSPEEMIYVGDSMTKDIEPARTLGWNTLLVEKPEDLRKLF